MKQKSNVDDWLERSSLLVKVFAGPGKPTQVTGDLRWLPAAACPVQLLGDLDRLADYFRQNVNDARGYIRDPGKLEQALEALERRVESVVTLRTVLNRKQYRTRTVSSPTSASPASREADHGTC